MVQFPPREFSFGRYDPETVPANVWAKNCVATWLLDQNVIGYCPSLECECRPQPNEVAVLVQDDDNCGYQTWCHIPSDIWNDYIDLCKRR